MTTNQPTDMATTTRGLTGFAYFHNTSGYSLDDALYLYNNDIVTLGIFATRAKREGELFTWRQIMSQIDHINQRAVHFVRERN